MIRKLLFLAVLALAQGRPNEFLDDLQLSPGGDVGAASDGGSGGRGGGDNVGELLPNGCPPDIVINWLPSQTDCSVYYDCVFGQRIPNSCPPGLHFNRITQRCDSPENAGCVLGTGGGAGGDGGSGGRGGGGNFGELLPNGCPPDIVINWLPSQTDCSVYYDCVFGQRIPSSCPPGLHFNRITQRCDLPENAGCVLGTGGGAGGDRVLG